MIRKRFSTQATAMSSFGLAALALGCSGGPATSAPATEQSAPHAAISDPTTQADGGGAPQTARTSSLSHGEAVALVMPPWSECTIDPEQTVPGRMESDRVPVGADGELRFFPPPAEWGSRLQIDCTTGDSHIRRTVDLKDVSTFVRKSPSELAARPVGVRAPLTPDELALPEAELVKRGYPRRPNRAAAPKAFAEWKRHVTTPVDLFAPVPVARLGARAGTFVGRGALTQWDGFVQSGSFDPTGASTGSVAYSRYVATITVPPSGSCQGPNCGTVIWAGIGGFATGASRQEGAIIQSGIDVADTLNNGIAVVRLFIEYAPSAPQLLGPPSGHSLQPFDKIEVQGWTSAASNCVFASTTGAYGCFYLVDLTQNWALIQAIQKSADRTFIPSTVEYVAERVQYGPLYNADYVVTSIYDAGALDSNGVLHGDPATGSDPYLWVTTGTGALYGGLSTAVFAGNRIDTPADPMYFVYNRSR